MSGPDERPSPHGSGRVLMLCTVVLAAAAGGVLALGIQDVRLLRLGLVAALWAALLGAFAAALMRREISADAHRVDELRTVYQLELEREVAARREYTLTVERELREQAQQAERGEIVALRAELAAVRVNLEKMVGGDPLRERLAPQTEPPCPAPHSRTGTEPSVRVSNGAVLGSPDLLRPLGEQFRADRSPVGSTLPTSEWPVNGHRETTPREDPEPRLDLNDRYWPELDTHVRPPVEPTSSGDRPWSPAVSSTPVWEPAPALGDHGISPVQSNGRHGAPSRESPESSNHGSHNNGSYNNGTHHNGTHSNGIHNNGSHNNGSRNNGAGARRAAQETPEVGAQRSVKDLLAAHGVGSEPRHRRSREEG
jgi:hypothetical protein